MTTQQRKELVKLRATARKGGQKNFGAVCQFMDSNFKSKIIRGLWKASVPQSNLSDGYHDVLQRVGQRLYQLRKAKRFPGWLRRISEEVATKHRTPFVPPSKQAGGKHQAKRRPKQIGTKWITVDGKWHPVRVFEPAPRLEQPPRRQLRFVEFTDPNLYPKSSFNRPDYIGSIAVRRALSKLPRRWALAIVLVKCVGLSVEEMAQGLGCSRQRAYKILGKAKDRLRGLLAEYARNRVANAEAEPDKTNCRARTKPDLPVSGVSPRGCPIHVTVPWRAA